jgi:hypothetical protein
METNSDEDAPIPAAADEPESLAPAEGAPQTPGESPAETESAPVEEPASEAIVATGDELGQLAAEASKARLSQSDEERLTTLLKEALLGGRAGVARAVEVLPNLPWIVAVRAVEQTWPQLTAGFRSQLLAGLAKDESDGARRIRLSLARALFKLEVPVALKLAIAVLKELRDKESGMLSQRNAQVVANVFIGRGKPWLTQLPLAELKPADIDLLVHCAVLAAFSVQHPPPVQLGVVKWAKEAERLDRLQEGAQAALLEGIARWAPKWQAVLRKEVAELPEAILAILKPAAPERAPAPERENRHRSVEDREESEADSEPGEEAAAPLRERPVYEPRPQKARDREESSEARPAPDTREDDSQRERPVYTPRHGGGGNVGRGGGFNLTESLRAIEGHVQSLRAELAAAQSKLRQREDDRRPRRAEKIGPIIEGEPTPEELARLNQQLEARNQELQSRLDDLKQHSEDVATSTGAMSGEPVTDGGSQLRTLLALKLQDDYADFLALEQEAPDRVVQQHYQTLMQHVFEVLREVQVPLGGAHSPTGS